MHVARFQFFDFAQREADSIGSGAGKLDVPWTRHSTCAQGAHYHCWIPPGLSYLEEKDLLYRFVLAARQVGDPVRVTYDYIPDGGPHGR